MAKRATTKSPAASPWRIYLHLASYAVGGSMLGGQKHIIISYCLYLFIE